MRLYWAAILSIFCCVESYYVTLTNDGPVVTGANITLVARLFEDDGTVPTGKFRFQWEDNDIRRPHTAVFDSDQSVSTWSVNYNLSGPGSYEVGVKVLHFTLTWWRIAGQTTIVNVTPFLNGAIRFFQNGSMDNSFVSSSQLVENRVVLTKPDWDFINRTYDKIQTHWFLDYSYMGLRDGLNFTYNYTKYLDANVTVKAYVVASLPKSENRSIHSNLISGDTVNSTMASPTISTPPTTSTTSTTLKPIDPVPPEFVTNTTCVPSDPNISYGCFQQVASVRGEVKNVEVLGNYWLRHGEMLNLSITCDGSPPFWHCIKILTGEYNTTGKENCYKTTLTRQCSVKVLHYFSEANEYTLLFIIGNQISRTVTPVRVTIYRVEKHAQLSVIIVPVTCSIVAVILIVFGVAYYIQSRNRYIVEVADFDFAQPSSDTEYKTLGERLRDAVSGAINRTQDWSQEDSCGGGGSNSGTVWSPSRKYGSMQ